VHASHGNRSVEGSVLIGFVCLNARAAFSLDTMSDFVLELLVKIEANRGIANNNLGET
jgi:hypothetical protein